jgi:hypothetical protein
MWYIQDKREMHAGFWWQNLQERGHLEDVGIDGILTLYCIPLPVGNVCISVSHTQIVPRWEQV